MGTRGPKGTRLGLDAYELYKRDSYKDGLLLDVDCSKINSEAMTIADNTKYNCTINHPENIPVDIISNSDGSVKMNYCTITGETSRRIGYRGFTIQFDMNLGSFTHNTGTNVSSLGNRNEIVLFTLDPDDMTKVNTSKVMHGKILSLVIVDFYVYVEYYEHLYYGISKERTMLRLYNVNDFKTRKIHTFSFMPLENGLKVKAYVTDSKTNISDNNLIASVTIPNLSLYSSDAEDVITYTQGYDISGDGSIVYQLSEPLVCDGKNENIISTKNELFDVDKTFTLLIDFTGDKGSYNGNSKVFTCLENAEPWYGLEIKTEGTYTIWYNQSRDVFDSLGNKIPYNSTLNQVYVFTKKKGSKTIRYYTSTSNSVNEIESEDMVYGKECNTILGVNGWKGTINRFIIYNRAMNDEEMKNVALKKSSSVSSSSTSNSNMIYRNNSYIHTYFYSKRNIFNYYKYSLDMQKYINETPRIIFKKLPPGDYVFEFNAGISSQSDFDRLRDFSKEQYKAKNITIEMLHRDSKISRVYSSQEVTNYSTEGAEPKIIKSYDYTLDYDNFGKVKCEFHMNEWFYLSLRINDEVEDKGSLGIDNVVLYKSMTNPILPGVQYSLGGPYLTNAKDTIVKPNIIDIYSMKLFDRPLFISLTEYLDLLAPSASDKVGDNGNTGKNSTFDDINKYANLLVNSIELIDYIDKSGQNFLSTTAADTTNNTVTIYCEAELVENEDEFKALNKKRILLVYKDNSIEEQMLTLDYATYANQQIPYLYSILDNGTKFSIAYQASSINGPKLIEGFSINQLPSNVKYCFLYENEAETILSGINKLVDTMENSRQKIIKSLDFKNGEVYKYNNLVSNIKLTDSIDAPPDN